MTFTRGMRALLLGALLTGLPAPAPAQEEPPPATEGAPTSPPSADQGIHPDAVSSFQVRTYRTSPKKLWRGLLQTLETSGYPPEEVDEKGKRVKTAFVDFKAVDYSEAVADPAP